MCLHYYAKSSHFPSHAVGNLLAAQFCNRALQEMPEPAEQIAQAEFGPLLGWLREHIHQDGKKSTPAELPRRVNGEAMHAGPFLI